MYNIFWFNLVKVHNSKSKLLFHFWFIRLKTVCWTLVNIECNTAIFNADITRCVCAFEWWNCGKGSFISNDGFHVLAATEIKFPPPFSPENKWFVCMSVCVWERVKNAAGVFCCTAVVGFLWNTKTTFYFSPGKNLFFGITSSSCLSVCAFVFVYVCICVCVCVHVCVFVCVYVCVCKLGRRSSAEHFCCYRKNSIILIGGFHLFFECKRSFFVNGLLTSFLKHLEKRSIATSGFILLLK